MKIASTYQNGVHSKIYGIRLQAFTLQSNVHRTPIPFSERNLKFMVSLACLKIIVGLKPFSSINSTG